VTQTPDIPRLPLNDGNAIPQLGFGVWQIPDAEAPGTVGAALDAGYRSIDTAAIYGNEAGIGRALKQTSLDRDAIFVTTKLWNDAQGFDETMRAFDASMGRLGLETLDLYLIHWPCPAKDAYVATWRAFVELRKQGRIRSIGVSNFSAEHLDRIVEDTGVAPSVNQIELHPGFQQRSLREAHARHRIVTEAWSPLGQGKGLDDPAIGRIAERHGRTPAQVVLRWHIEIGTVAIPKSANPQRIAQNIDVFGFSLTEEDHAVIAGLDRADGRIGPDPATFS